jgi:RNA polymerase sigma-70 factor (ECF subfamily)
MTNGNGGNGRDERFQSLYQKYYRRMVRYFMRVFRLSEEDAEDLTQEAFARFHKAMDEYRGDAEWAFFEIIAQRTAYNRFRARNTARRNGKAVDVDDPKVRPQLPSTQAPDYAELEEKANQRKSLYHEIATLPEGQRQCIQLWLDDLQYDEIARVLNITLDAVRSRLRDARKLLRTRLGSNTFPEDEQ